ncbi:hypothetical protein QN405_26440, partial [Pseudomonas sp. AH2 (2023)]|nr:hypothetical protein [Pseudomonas sp. AH2 (2023)]
VLHAEQTNLPIQIAGVASILYGLYAFTLPKTPPKAKDGKVSVVSLLGLDAIKSADRSFWTLIICSLLLMIPVAFYHAYANT